MSENNTCNFKFVVERTSKSIFLIDLFAVIYIKRVRYFNISAVNSNLLNAGMQVNAAASGRTA